MEHRVIVVGSGCTGAQAAQTLIEQGAKVLMLDVGNFDKEYGALVPKKDFIELRQTDDDQWKYLLGKRFEGIQWGPIKVGSQLTPPRKFVMQGIEKWIPTLSSTFSAFESLAKGGLGNAWGAGCHVFSEKELHAIGLNQEEMQSHYQTVADRIGISASIDDVQRYGIGSIKNFQPSLPMERQQQRVLEAYVKNKPLLNKSGFYLGRNAVAALSEPLNSRPANACNDMDFWSVHDASVYRPWVTIDALKKHPNFEYVSNALVVSFVEGEGNVTIHYIDTISKEKKSVIGIKLVLASGVLGTARIVLRSVSSLNHFEEKLPILSNPYSYMPGIRMRDLGLPMLDKKSSFCQLVMYHDPTHTNFNVGMGALFSYRSLLLAKLIKEAPLNFRDGREIMQYLQSAFVIAGVHHPEVASKDKWIQLSSSSLSPTGDELFIHYQASEEERAASKLREKQWRWALRRLGIWVIKKVDPGNGSSIHYAGTLPFSEKDERLRCLPSGRLGQHQRVYVADGSGFRYLPAKGLTLTLMANAHRVALEVVK